MWVPLQKGSTMVGPEEAYGNPWKVFLGRLDSSEPGPNRLPADDAPVEEIRVRGLQNPEPCSQTLNPELCCCVT